MDSAGAALTDAAAEFCACHPEHVTENPEQRHVIGDLDRMRFSINQQGSHRSFLD
jgi:hypothetical protein